MPSTAASQRVTLTLPPDVVQEIDRQGRNRSKFVLEAVRHDLERRRREELRRSLRNPHPQSLETAELGMDEWASHLPEEDVGEITDPAAGRAVRWEPERGWIEGEE